MQQADFVHLVRLSEHASAADSRAYRRSVAAFAALGYAWVLGCLLLSIGLLAWVLPALWRGQWRAIYLWLGLAALALLWACLRALWVRMEEPAGVHITAKEAPALFEALERLRRKVKGPPIHAVYLDAEFNASIQQTPRWGLLGGTVNTLTLGLPLLMALDKARVLAVLAHEYGHLRGDHGRFAAWIYRTRQSWLRLHHHMGSDAGVAAWATQAFLQWYYPRFAAKTFALARQDEYEADRIAGKLLGREVAAAALIELEVKGAWLQDEFWAQHWRQALAHELPVGPYPSLRAQMALAPEPLWAREALRQAWARISDADDTHPGLRDRVEALDGQARLPAWSQRNALSLLGEGGERWLAHFDRQWCREHASDWKLQHATLQRVQARTRVLAARRATANARELVEEAGLLLRLDPQAPVKALYEQALAISPGAPEALRGLAQALPARAREERMACLAQLWETSEAHRWWAACRAVEALETPAPEAGVDLAVLKLWRERLKQAEVAEQRAWEELALSDFFSRVQAHDLTAFELAEVQAELARCKPLARCWLLNKSLAEFPQRRAYLVFVELPSLAHEAAQELCRALERSLSLPGPALAVVAGESPTVPELRRVAKEPIFQR